MALHLLGTTDFDSETILDPEGTPEVDAVVEIKEPETVTSVEPMVIGTESLKFIESFGKHLTMRAVTPLTTEGSKTVRVYYNVDESGKRIYWCYIFGVITEPAAFVELMSILDNAEADDEITIYISSPGGCVYAGSMVASCIVGCKAKVTTVAMGQCASAGSLIWSAGHACLAMKTAQFMYHMSSHWDGGNTVKVLERAGTQKRYVRDCLLADALQKGHITAEELELLVETENNLWINPMDMAQRLLKPVPGSEEVVDE